MLPVLATDAPATCTFPKRSFALTLPVGPIGCGSSTPFPLCTNLLGPSQGDIHVEAKGRTQGLRLFHDLDWRWLVQPIWPSFGFPVLSIVWT
jgi:hypothetical protein